MQINLKIIILIFVGVSLISGNFSDAIPQEKRVRAKIGIQIRTGDRSMRAKSRDRLKAGDLLRIYVHPEVTSHVYVVHTDHKTATLLNMVQQKIQSSTLVMPSIQEFYQIDGNSSKESFTIICSPKELTDIITLFGSGEVPHPRWVELEKSLSDKGKIDLSQKAEKPFSIAGNVRGSGGSVGIDPFVNKLQIFSGKSVLVKKYEFKVKK